MKKRRCLAVVMAATMILTGCGGKKKNDDITTISWYLPGVKIDSSFDNVFNRVNDMLSERYNLKLNIQLIDSSNFEQKMQMMNASREEYDLVFTSNWKNNFYTNIDNGALADLTEVLPLHAPTLYESLSQAEKDAATVKGKLYAVPNWQVQARACGFCYPKEYVDETGVDIDEINTLEDIEPYLAEVVKKHPDTNKTGGGWHHIMAYYGMVTIVQQGLPGAIRFSQSGKPQVINQYDTEEFKEFAGIMRNYVEKGYLSGVLGTKDYRKSEYKQAPLWWDGWKPGQDSEDSNRVGYDVITKQVSPAILSAESILGTATGISANSKHIEDACKMLEIIHTDKEIYNTLCWGLEGVDYEKVSDNIIRVLDESNYSISNWMIGSVKNSYILEGNSEDLWEKTQNFNDSAVVSPLNGFPFDNSLVCAELGNCETVVKEYLDTIQYGLSENPEEYIAKFNEELKIAGVDTVLEEIQKQIDEWWQQK